MKRFGWMATILAIALAAVPALAKMPTGPVSAGAGSGGVTKGTLVKLSAAGTIVTATGVGDSVVGVCETTADANELTSYSPPGANTTVTSGEAIAVGDFLTAGTGGKAFVLDDSDSNDQRYAALALTAATDADQDVAVIVVCGSELSFTNPATLTVTDATTPYVATAAGKTNTGYVQINGKTTGATKFTTADATAYTLTSTTATQTVGAGTVTLPDLAGSTTGIYAITNLAQTFTNKALTAPAITGGTAIELTGLSVRSTGAAFDVLLASSDAALGADRTIFLNPGASNRTVALGGDVSFGAAVTTVGALNLSGAYSTVGDDAIILRTSAATDLTVPTTGTLATLAGSETLTNKTLTAPAVTGGTAIELTGLSVRSTGAAFDVLLASSDAALGVDRTIFLNPGASNRTVAIGGDLSFGAAVTTVGALNLSGAYSTVGDDAIILRTSAATDLTVPTTGTLATLTGAETLATKTIDGDDNTVQDLGVGVHKVLTAVTTSNVGNPFVIVFAPTGAGTLQYTVPAGKKLRVIDAYGFKTAGAGAHADDELTLQNNDGTPANIFDKEELNAVGDGSRFQFDVLADTEHEVAATKTLDLVANENAANGCDSLVYVTCVWVTP